MKFRRIDSKTVSCIITPEDMKAHGIKLDDIFEKKEEAMEFLHMVVGEAERRVNFRPQGAVTPSVSRSRSSPARCSRSS